MIGKEIPQDKIWKYAKTELERRFLLKSRPGYLSPYSSIEIVDNYLDQTHIRVRSMFDGNSHTYKLTKKLVLIPGNQAKHWISTIYLNKPEYDLFMTLPGNMLKKKRYRVATQFGEMMGIDEIRTESGTIWIAEVEFADEKKMQAAPLPFAYEREITHDYQFAGFKLAERYGNRA